MGKKSKKSKSINTVMEKVESPYLEAASSVGFIPEGTSMRETWLAVTMHVDTWKKMGKPTKLTVKVDPS